MTREIDLGSIMGPQGPKGDPGEKGEKGEKGDPGTTIASGITYADTNVEAALDELNQAIEDINYKAITINTFTNSVNTAEMGSTVNTVVLNWTTSKTPKTLTLDGEEIDKSLKTKTIENAGIKTNNTYTLKAVDERDAASTKTTTISFLNGLYYGVGNVEADAVDSAFVQGLTKKLTSSRTGDFKVNATGANKIYYAIPTRLGTPVFYVGGFEGGFSKLKTFAYTNPSGYQENYDVYISTNAGLGDTTVTVK